MDNSSKKSKIGLISAIMLIVLALLFDLMSFIPIIGNIMTWIFWVIISVYFWFIGMGVVNNKRIVIAISSGIIESIPFISWVPSITVGMIAIILMSVFEDKTGISLNKITKNPGITPPRTQRKQVNAIPGIRHPTNTQDEEISTNE